MEDNCKLANASWHRQTDTEDDIYQHLWKEQTTLNSQCFSLFLILWQTPSFRNLSKTCCVGKPFHCELRTKEKTSETLWRRKRKRGREPGERNRQLELALEGTRKQGERVKERWDFRSFCEGLKEWKQLQNKKQNRESLQSAWYNVWWVK